MGSTELVDSVGFMGGKVGNTKQSAIINEDD